MSDNLDDFKNIYLPKIETKEDALRFMKKGMFFKQNRIEEVFYQKFVKLRRKIHKVLSDEFVDDLDYDVYVNSILIDCRAIFLEKPSLKFNSTLQGTYKARGLDNYAKGIDDCFEEPQPVFKGKSLKVVIKDWVDQILVHADYLELEDDKLVTENIQLIIDRATLCNIFNVIIIIAQQYEEVREFYGKNTEDQINKTLSWLTG